MNSIAIIQCTAADLCKSTDPEDYVVGPLRRSGLFNDIIIAAPRLGDVARLEAQALEWGIRTFIGHDYDICTRILAAADLYVGATVTARVILRRFYIDLELIARMLDLIRNGHDYVSLGNDINYEVAADVASLDAFRRVDRILSIRNEDYDTANYRFYPWRLMEDDQSFRVAKIETIPAWTHTYACSVRERLGRILIEQGQNQVSVDASAPAGRYRHILPWISDGASVADIACGQGGGCQILAERAGSVLGIDCDSNYIAAAISNNSNSRVTYRNGTDALLAEMPAKFDIITSLHTLEHVDKPTKFLSNVYRSIKPCGLLLLEVPRLLPLPMGMPLFPFHHIEYRPETLEPLLIKTGFIIEERLGGNRGTYGPLDTAREVLFYICRTR